MVDIPIKRKLAEGKPVLVVGGEHNANMVEYLGQFGFDGVWIECEHGTVSWEQISDMSRACDVWNVASVTRVTTNDPALIGRTLDCGASGIVIPHVSTRSAAEQVVRAAKFAPIGMRGMGGGRRAYGATDYLVQANQETLVVILLEEIEAIRNLSDILAVDNIDVFFIAPGDLSQTMGYPGQPYHPEVRAVIEQSVREIIGRGRVAGLMGLGDELERSLELGARFILTNWLPWIAAAATDTLRRFNAFNEKRG